MLNNSICSILVLTLHIILTHNNPILFAMKKILLTALSVFFFFCATAQNIYLRGSFNTPAYAATQLTQMRGLVNTVTLNTILSGTKDFYFGSADNTYLWRPNTTPIASNTASTWSGSASTNGSLYFVFGRSYTFNLIQNTNVVSVLETAASPVSIPTVAQMPLADVGVNVPVTVSVTTSSAPPSDQNVYLRYSLNSFKTSTLIKVLMSGSTGTATIPAVANGTIVQYYVFTSPLTEAAIATEVTNLTEKVYEVLALKTNGTTLSPYSYRVGTLSNTSATPGSGATIQTNATNFYGIMKSNSTYSYSNRHVYIYPKSVLSPLINGSYINTLTFFREVSFGSALVPGQARFKIYLANTTAANWGSTTSLNWSTATNLGVQVWQGDPASSVGDGSAAQVNFAIPQTALCSKTEVLVRFNEADPLGIVWHGHYIRYFEDGREAFGNLHDLGYLEVYKLGFVIPVVSVQCDFKRSLRYGDRVIVETKFIPTDAAKLKFTYRLFNAASGELVATGSSVQVFLSKEDSVLQLSNPPFFEEWKIKHDQV